MLNLAGKAKFAPRPFPDKANCHGHYKGRIAPCNRVVQSYSQRAWTADGVKSQQVLYILIIGVII